MSSAWRRVRAGCAWTSAASVSASRIHSSTLMRVPRTGLSHAPDWKLLQFRADEPFSETIVRRSGFSCTACCAILERQMVKGDTSYTFAFFYIDQLIQFRKTPTFLLTEFVHSGNFFHRVKSVHDRWIQQHNRN